MEGGMWKDQQEMQDEAWQMAAKISTFIKENSSGKPMPKGVLFLALIIRLSNLQWDGIARMLYEADGDPGTEFMIRMDRLARALPIESMQMMKPRDEDKKDGTNDD